MGVFNLRMYLDEILSVDMISSDEKFNLIP